MLQFDLHRKSQISPSLKVDIYNQLTILNRIHGSCINGRLHQLMYCMGAAAVMGNVGIIRFHEDLSIFDIASMAFFGQIVYGMFLGWLHFFGTLPFTCEQYLESLGEKPGKMLRKRVRCLKSFGIKCPPERIMRFSAIFHMMAAGLNMIVTLLVLCRKEMNT